MESLFHGVPMVGIPFNGDQNYNAGRAKNRGYGEVVELHGITADELYNKMHQVINDPSYRENIQKCSRIIKSMETPDETLIRWVEHILAFGGKHLRPTSTEMPLYKILMLDLYTFVLLVIFVAFKVLSFILRFVYRKCCKSQKAKTE